MLRDVRFALRQLRRSPGLTTAAVLTLALGIGANTAVFSVFDGVLLRPAPFPDVDRLAMVWQTDRNSGTTREPASVPDYADFRAMGIYGVIAYLVAQRTREIGSRMALGARKSGVLRLVLRQGLAFAVVGILVGLAASAALTRLLASFLYDVSALDPLTFVSAALLLLGFALTATYVPARRAARVDPARVLKAQ